MCYQVKPLATKCKHVKPSEGFGVQSLVPLCLFFIVPLSVFNARCLFLMPGFCRDQTPTFECLFLVSLCLFLVRGPGGLLALGLAGFRLGPPGFDVFPCRNLIFSKVQVFGGLAGLPILKVPTLGFSVQVLGKPCKSFPPPPHSSYPYAAGFVGIMQNRHNANRGPTNTKRMQLIHPTAI